MLKGGYMGKILRVDLSKKTITDEALPSEDVLRKYIGGVGLGLKYLYDEVDPSIEPLDPESRLIFMTGPLTGTVWPCSSRHIVISLNSDFSKTPGTSWGGGFWAAKLRWAGYDGVIVQGKSDEPVYILIQDGKPTLRDAKYLWGKDTVETEELIREEIGDPECSAAVIGPAGENCLHASIILNDRSHVAGKGGGGQLMGSKLLKAIAISGSGGAIPLVDARKLTELALEYRQALLDSPVVDMNYHGGLPTHYDVWPATLTTYKNFTDTVVGGGKWGSEVMDVVRESKVIIRPCFNCPLGCHCEITVGKGPYKGLCMQYSGGGGIEGIGCRVGAMEGGANIFIADLANRLGLETGIVGAKIGLLYECYEKGMIDKDFTDGLELKWGNADATITLLHKLVDKEGIGVLLNKGQDEIAEAIGKGADKFLEGCKGLAFHHDYRESWEVVLCHAVGTCGVSPEGFGWDAFYPAMAQEFGHPGLLPKFDEDRAPLAVRLTAMKNRWDNVIGVCQFSNYGTVGSTEYTTKAMKLAVGWDIDFEEALLIGDRLMSLARVFGLRRGLSIDDDLNCGPRLLEGQENGENEDHPIGPHLEAMVKGYYSKMGWDPETGIPLDETLKRVGLDELIDVVKELRSNPVKKVSGTTKESRNAKKIREE